jgi:hypothetical protein
MKYDPFKGKFIVSITTLRSVKESDRCCKEMFVMYIVCSLSDTPCFPGKDDMEPDIALPLEDLSAGGSQDSKVKSLSGHGSQVNQV